MKRLFVLDAFNLIYRNFFAVPMMHTKSGMPVNAIYGMTKLLVSILQDDHPDGIVVAYDGPGPTIRSATYDAYKGTRDKMPDELRSQLSFIEELFVALRIPMLILEGHEADDIMASIAHQYGSSECEVSLLSSDKDLYQVLSDHVRIVDGMKKLVAREKECVEKFGVGSKYVRDYLAIVWDSSDNIPGIKGFGPKKAVDLINRFGHVPDIYEHIGELPQKMQDVLIVERENAFLSLDLATVIIDLEVGFSVDDAYISSSERFHLPSFIQFLAKMEFHSLLKKFGWNASSLPTGNPDDDISISSRSISPFPISQVIVSRDIWQRSIQRMNASPKIWLTYEVFASNMILIYSDGVQSYSVSSSMIPPWELLEIVVGWVHHPSITLYADNLKYLLRSLEISSQGIERSIVEEVFG